MKAAVLTEYGPPDVLQLREVARPQPGDGDVLIRVHATSVNFGDTIAVRAWGRTPNTCA